jgi:hypothetical protein
MHEMVNREARHDGVKCAQSGQRAVEVMDDQSYRRIVTKTFASRIQHRGREIDCDRVGRRMLSFHQREKASVSRTEIEYPVRALRNELEQRRFAFLAMRNRIGPLEIIEGVVGLAPKVNGHGKV